MMQTNRRGFSLWEMLFIISLFGVAGLLASRLFTASMRSIEAAPLAQERQLGLDRMFMVLRRDVWGASQIDTNGTMIALTLRGQQVQWQFKAASVSRSIDNSSVNVEVWKLPFEITAHGDGASLVLQVADIRSETRRFLSQVLAARGTR